MPSKKDTSSGGRSKLTAGEGPSRGQFKRGRKPHNVKPAADIASLEDLVLLVGSEPRKLMLKGELREISRAERTLRLTVDRALEGKVRPLATILRCMIKYPQMSKSFQEETVIIIAGNDRFA